jgi:hypothetical protein
MPDPKRGLTIREVELDGARIAADEVVWVHARGNEFVEIEHRNRHGKVPADAVVPYPVKGPDLETLRQLDRCFGLTDDAFTAEHVSAKHCYTLVRCRAHGRRFLQDLRGGIAMFTLLTLLEDDEPGAPDEIWSKYHSISDSRLRLLGRTL